MTRSAISKIEVAARGVSVDEWLALAYALSVPPILLLVDLEAGDDIAVAPEVSLHPWLAWQWMRGDAPPVTPDGTVVRPQEFHEARWTIDLCWSRLMSGRSRTQVSAYMSVMQRDVGFRTP